MSNSTKSNRLSWLARWNLNLSLQHNSYESTCDCCQGFLRAIEIVNFRHCNCSLVSCFDSASKHSLVSSSAPQQPELCAQLSLEVLRAHLAESSSSLLSRLLLSLASTFALSLCRHQYCKLNHVLVDIVRHRPDVAPELACYQLTFETTFIFEGDPAPKGIDFIHQGGKQ